MASPDSSGKPAPKSPPVQDSPIFGYVSSLSPIKPVNARPTVQVYENIDVPSPQLIFKTPNFSRPRNSNVLERSQHSGLAGAENLSPGYANNFRVFSQNMGITRSSLSSPMVHLISCSDKEEASENPSPNQSCTSPSNCVDAFLANSLEGENSSSSPDFCVMQAAKDIQDDRIISSENQMKSIDEGLPADRPHTSSISVKEQIDDNLEKSISMPLGCLQLKQDSFPPHFSHNDSISTKESSLELCIADGKKHTSRKTVASSRQPYQSEEDPANEPLAAETMEINRELISEKVGTVFKNATIYSNSFDVSDSITPNSYRYQHAKDQSFVSTAEGCDIAHHGKENLITSDVLLHDEQDLKLQTDKTGESDELDCTPQLHPGSPQNIETGDNHIDDSVQSFCAATGNQSSYDQEDGAHHQRGKRKRLQFEAVENFRITSSNSCNYTTETTSIDLPISSLEVEKVNVSHAESIMISTNKQAIQSVTVNDPSVFPVGADKFGPYRESLPLTAPRPSGIGLHLNSIGSTASKKCNTNIHAETSAVEDNDQVSQRMKTDPSRGLIGPEKLTMSSEISIPYVGNRNDKEEERENQTLKVTIPSIDPSPLSCKLLNRSVPLKHIDRYMTPCIMKRLPSEETTRSEESTQSSPRKKRKKATENDGHKLCNCKRSKCLKLYCDCFAAGSFCSEACACRECFNKLEHQDTVIESRQQIESRNPLAFAPKVVVRVSNPPKDSEDNKPITSSSARHKRGCNCKKSLCLKKYCECFQAGVGCSSGCRCEGCKNTFGRKDGCDISEMIVEHRRPKEGWERDLSGELEGIEVKGQLSNPKQCHSGLSPLTPVVQSTIGNDVSKPHFPASYYPSPESSSVDIDSIKKGESSSLIPSDPSTTTDPFSPGWDWEGFPDLCLSPLLKFTPNPGGSSSSTSTSERKVLQMKLFQGSSRISLGSLCWRSSPVTPLPHFGESKPHHCSNPEDDTPEILKEGGSPIKAVKATSPNQKRVSPPHQIACSSNSNSKSPSGVRSVRKIILQSVPAFPPLTPYSTNNREDGT